MIGIIILVIGIIIGSIGVVSVITAKNVSELENDFNHTTNTFKSYGNGDKFILTGKIGSIIETKYIFANTEKTTDDILKEKYSGKYIYILENNLEISSNDNIGKIGDTVYIECVVKEITNIERTEEILKVNQSYNLLATAGYSMGFLIIGSITIVIVKQKRRVLIEPNPEALKIAQLYEAAEEENDETVLMHFMQREDSRTEPVPEQAAATNTTTNMTPIGLQPKTSIQPIPIITSTIQPSVEGKISGTITSQKIQPVSTPRTITATPQLIQPASTPRVEATTPQLIQPVSAPKVEATTPQLIQPVSAPRVEATTPQLIQPVSAAKVEATIPQLIQPVSAPRVEATTPQVTQPVSAPKVEATIPQLTQPVFMSKVEASTPQLTQPVAALRVENEPSKTPIARPVAALRVENDPSKTTNYYQRNQN